MKNELSIMIFRRDLRLEDNTALIQALEDSKKVIPIFILDKRQLENNPYRSEPIVEFMFESLKDLDSQLKEKSNKLYLFYGESEEIIKKLLKDTKAQAVYFNRDYTPFSIKRDEKIKKMCEQQNAELNIFADALLHEPEEIHKSDGNPYTVYTPFYKYSRTVPIKKSEKNKRNNYYKEEIKESKKIDFLNSLSLEKNKNNKVSGGRREALKILKKISSQKEYDLNRNFPELDATTKLSAHNKFGTVSIREVYEKIKEELGEDHTLIREIYWRDFFTHIAYHFPHVFGSAFNKKFRSINWSQNKEKFRAWCEGRTGFPIVDAGMRELNETGYMHNRVRMIVASFLVKDLHIDWRKGEKYFAQKLIDYDPSVNNGNWQWAASTGCDAQPYFRIFNPWLQQKKFDNECKYIKKWVPEVKDLSTKEIHEYDKNNVNVKEYPRPIIDHYEEKEKTLEMFKAVSALQN